MNEIDLTIGQVAHHAFCPRRAWLEVQGEQTDTGQMAAGTHDHRAVDDPSTSRRQFLRGVDVVSEELGVRGRCDTVERDEDGALTVVEHKATPKRRKSEVTRPQAIQVALQALCLREAGHEVTGAAVWFSTQRERVRVELDDELLAATRAEVSRTRSTLRARTPPPPLTDDPRCNRCSHVSVCLPDEHVRRVPSRRIGVGDPIGKILHLSTPGSIARLRRRQVVVSAPDEDPVKVPFGQITGIVVHGNADVSSALLRESFFRGLPIVWCTWSGRVTGWGTPADGPNGEIRSLQYRLGADAALDIARSMIGAKIANQRYLLRRHKLSGREELAKLAVLAQGSGGTNQLFGVEGRAAAVYFRELGAALKPSWISFRTRAGHPARDPVNATFDLTYSLLLADVIRAVIACGLDPSGGVLHSPKHNKPALALDLMEELRPTVADSVVLWAFNNGELKESSFHTGLDGVVRMSEKGRKKLIATYERRVQTEFKHPQFGYKVTWRRAMEVQARLFMATLNGERDSYDPIALR